MAFVRKFFYRKNGKVYGPYYRLVRSKRVGDKITQENLKYISKTALV